MLAAVGAEGRREHSSHDYRNHRPVPGRGHSKHHHRGGEATIYSDPFPLLRDLKKRKSRDHDGGHRHFLAVHLAA